jgi:hypothetical protein
MDLPEPDFYIHDQAMDGTRNYIVRRENPMPACPHLATTSLGLFTAASVRQLLRAQTSTRTGADLT